MATTRSRLLLPVLALLLAGAAVFPVSAARNFPAGRKSALGRAGVDPSAYEMLETFGFPRGILPVGVTGYTLLPDGRFQVFFERECEFEVEGGYKLTYQKTISGKVAAGNIESLRGVSVKIFFVNLGIDRLLRLDTGHIMFNVGPLSESFSVDNFEESPECHCNGIAIEETVGHGAADFGVRTLAAM